MSLINQGLGNPVLLIGQGYQSGAVVAVNAAIVTQGLGAGQRLILQGFGGAPTPPPTGTATLYTVEWAGSNPIFVVGANGPLRFSVSADSAIPGPDSATFYIYAFQPMPTVDPPDPLITIPATLEGDGSEASTQYLHCYYAGARGVYTVKLLATFGQEIAGGETLVIFNQ